MNPSSPQSHPETTRQSHLPLRRPRGGFTVEHALRWGLRLALLGAVVWAVWFFSNLVLYLGIGVLLAFLLKPIVDRLQGIGIGRVGSILITVLVMLMLISTVVSNLVPMLVRQVADLSDMFSPQQIRGLTTTIETWLNNFVNVEDGAVLDAVARTTQTLFAEDRLSATVGTIVSLFTDLFYAVLVIPFVTFFVLKDGTRISHSLYRLVPNRYFEITLAVVDKCESILGRYFRGLFLQSASIAVLASTLLSVAGLGYAVPVGIFTGIANTIPYFGPAMGFVAGTLVGIGQTGDFSLLPGVLIAMSITQIADNVFFQPLIFSRVARTHPLVILFVVLIGAQLAGLVGMLVAIPFATVVRVSVEQVIWSFRNYRILQVD